MCVIHRKCKSVSFVNLLYSTIDVCPAPTTTANVQPMQQQYPTAPPMMQIPTQFHLPPPTYVMTNIYRPPMIVDLNPPPPGAAPVHVCLRILVYLVLFYSLFLESNYSTTSTCVLTFTHFSTTII